LKRTASVLFAILLAGTIVLEIGEIVQHRPRVYTIGLDTAATAGTTGGSGSREAFLQKSFEAYCAANHWRCLVGSGGDAVARVRRMIRSGVNGLIVSAQLPGPVLEEAAAAHVPVFATDGDIDSPDVTMYVGFSGESAGRELARAIVSSLRSHHGGQARGTVLEMTGPPGSISAAERSRGVHSVIERYRSVTVISAAGDFREASARAAAERVLRANPFIDACFSASGSMAAGVVDALKDLGRDPARIYTATIDATPRVLQLIREGDIQMALGQTPGFYSAIAAHYLVQYLEHGRTGLPRVGETIAAGNLDLSAGSMEAPFDILGNRAPWAPARVARGLGGHTWFQTGTVVVTRDNVDAPYLWANIKLSAKA
jgi:ABC-type sugar transport system substrate-binding protein